MELDRSHVVEQLTINGKVYVSKQVGPGRAWLQGVREQAGRSKVRMGPGCA